MKTARNLAGVLIVILAVAVTSQVMRRARTVEEGA